MEVLTKIVLTLILLGGIYVVWTRPINVAETLSRPFSFIAFKKQAKLDVDFRQILGTKFANRPCLLFWVLRFVNNSAENVTLKEIRLRFQGPLGKHDVESTVLTTGEVQPPNRPASEAIVIRGDNPPNDQLFIENWKNFRAIIGEYKTLSPGAVLAGSAAFVLDGMTGDQFKKLKTVELIAVDFADNETTTKIDITPEMMQLFDAASAVNRAFVAAGDRVQWK
jgi:hypothetical protein